jgi:hypothetical protein
MAFSQDRELAVGSPFRKPSGNKGVRESLFTHCLLLAPNSQLHTQYGSVSFVRDLNPPNPLKKLAQIVS